MVSSLSYTNRKSSYTVWNMAEGNALQLYPKAEQERLDPRERMQRGKRVIEKVQEVNIRQSPFSSGTMTCMCAKSLQSCPTLCDLMDSSPPGSTGFSRQEYCNGLPCSPPGDLPNPRIEPMSPEAPALQMGSLLLSHWGSPRHHDTHMKTRERALSSRLSQLLDQGVGKLQPLRPNPATSMHLHIFDGYFQATAAGRIQ